jgi:predicted double-glycine peptidase
LNAPNELDGAKVIVYTKNTPNNNYGTVDSIDENNVVLGEKNITALAICKYANCEECYLFSCDSHWEVIGDTFHNTIAEAKSWAKISFSVNELDWIEGE